MHTYNGLSVEVTGQLFGVSSVLLPLCCFGGENLGHQACLAILLTLGAILLVLFFLCTVKVDLLRKSKKYR